MNLIDKLEALDKGATPGPWERADIGPSRNIRAVIQREEDDWVPVAYFSDSDGDGLAVEPEHDANIIVAMRNALPALLRLARAAVAMRQDSEVWSDADVAEFHAAVDALTKEQP